MMMQQTMTRPIRSTLLLCIVLLAGQQNNQVCAKLRSIATTTTTTMTTNHGSQQDQTQTQTQKRQRNLRTKSLSLQQQEQLLQHSHMVLTTDGMDVYGTTAAAAAAPAAQQSMETRPAITASNQDVFFTQQFKFTFDNNAGVIEVQDEDGDVEEVITIDDAQVPSDMPSMGPTFMEAIIASDAEASPSDMPSMAPNFMAEIIASDTAETPSDMPSMAPSFIPSKAPVSRTTNQEASIDTKYNFYENRGDVVSEQEHVVEEIVASDAQGPSDMPSLAPSFMPVSRASNQESVSSLGVDKVDAKEVLPNDVQAPPSDMPSMAPSSMPLSRASNQESVSSLGADEVDAKEVLPNDVQAPPSDMPSIAPSSMPVSRASNQESVSSLGANEEVDAKEILPSDAMDMVPSDMPSDAPSISSR